MNTPRFSMTSLCCISLIVFAAPLAVSAEPIPISTCEDLQNVGTSSHPSLGDTSAVYQLQNNIVCTGYDFHTIGNGQSFNGTLDGAGYAIYDLHIVPDESNTSSALFYRIGPKGRIQNLGLRNARINARYHAAGISVLLEGEIQNVFVHGRITAEYGLAGGITSYILGLSSDTPPRIRESMFAGNVQGKYYAGGLAGYILGGEVHESFSIGDVRAKISTGGLAGYARGYRTPALMINSYAKGNIASSYTVGGLIGRGPYREDGSMIVNSYSRAQLDSDNASRGNGLIGYGEMDILHAYWDAEAAPGVPVDEHARSAQEMLQQDTYEPWDFNVIWDIDDGIIAPYLRSSSSEASVICLTDDQADLFEHQPAVSDTIVVWRDKRGSDDESGGRLYYEELETPFAENKPVPGSSGAYQFSASGRQIVWTASGPAGQDVFYIDLKQEHPEPQNITDDGVNQKLVSIDGSMLVWVETNNGASDIIVYDLNTQTKTALITGRHGIKDVIARDGKVFWREQDYLLRRGVAYYYSNTYNFFYTQTSSESAGAIVAIQQNFENRFPFIPDFDGRYAVWYDINGIYVYDTDESVMMPLAVEDSPHNVSVNAGRVVYTAGNAVYAVDVRTPDETDVITRTNYESNQWNVDFGGRHVVWLRAKQDDIMEMSDAGIRPFDWMMYSFSPEEFSSESQSLVAAAKEAIDNYFQVVMSGQDTAASRQEMDASIQAITDPNDQQIVEEYLMEAHWANTTTAVDQYYEVVMAGQEDPRFVEARMGYLLENAPETMRQAIEEYLMEAHWANTTTAVDQYYEVVMAGQEDPRFVEARMGYLLENAPETMRQAIEEYLMEAHWANTTTAIDQYFEVVMAGQEDPRFVEARMGYLLENAPETMRASLEEYYNQHEVFPPTAVAVTINGGADVTDSLQVTLNLSATDNDSGMGPGAQMRFSNDNETWSEPREYAQTADWTLTRGGGIKTVYAKFKDAAGNWSSIVSDTIQLNEDHSPQISRADQVGTTVTIGGAHFGTSSYTSSKYNPRADFSGDGKVSLSDLGILAGHYGQTVSSRSDGDANGDGIVNLSDLSILAGAYGSTRGNSYVTIGGIEALVTSWSDTEIVCQIPYYVSGDVEVKVIAATEESNSIMLTTE